MLTQVVSSLCKSSAETEKKVDPLKVAVEDNAPNPTVDRQDLDSAFEKVGAMTLHESLDEDIIDDFDRSGFEFESRIAELLKAHRASTPQHIGWNPEHDCNS